MVLCALKTISTGPRLVSPNLWKEPKDLPISPAMMAHSLAYFQAQGGQAQSMGFATLLMMGVLFLIMYLLIFRPQAQRQKEWQKMLETIENGDQVITGGGIVGVVISVKDDRLHLRVAPDNLRMEVTKSSVMHLAKPEAKEKK